MVMKMPPVKDRGPKLPLTKLNLSASGARPNQRQKPPLSSILLDGSVLMPSLADSEAVRARCDDRGVPTEEVLAEMRAADPRCITWGHAEGPPDALGEASDRPAMAAGATRCAGQTLGTRRRALRSGAKPRPCRQGDHVLDADPNTDLVENRSISAAGSVTHTVARLEDRLAESRQIADRIGASALNEVQRQARERPSPTTSERRSLNPGRTHLYPSGSRTAS